MLFLLSLDPFFSSSYAVYLRDQFEVPIVMNICRPKQKVEEKNTNSFVIRFHLGCYFWFGIEFDIDP